MRHLVCGALILSGLAGDTETGALQIDDTFRDNDRKPGFSFENREWPQGWKGSGWPHGAVFSR